MLTNLHVFDFSLLLCTKVERRVGTFNQKLITMYVNELDMLSSLDIGYI